MNLPKYHETFIPILDILSTKESLNHRELGVSVRDKYYSNLPQDLLSMQTSTGANVLLDRIGWGKSYLKMGKFVQYPSRGTVQITEKGRQALRADKLTLKDVKNDQDFTAHQEATKSKKENETEELQSESASPQELIDLGFGQKKHR
jgi:restriction system protein